MAVSIDASGVQSQTDFTIKSSRTINVTTTAASGILLVGVFLENSTGVARTVSSVSATGLTFAKRKALANANTNCNNGDLEVWWAAWSGGALSALAVLVNFSGSCDGSAVCVVPLNGANSLSTPFDSNASLVASATTAAAQANASVTFATTQAHDMLCGWALGTCTTSSDGTCFDAPSGWTQPSGSIGAGGDVEWLNFGFYYKIVTSAQGSGAVTIPSQNGAKTDGFVCFIDAVTADAPSSTETGTAVFTLNQVTFTGQEADVTAQSGSFVLNQIKFAAAAFFNPETGQGVFRIAQFVFSAAASFAESATGVFKMAQFLLFGAGLESPPAGKGKRHFWTFGA